MNSSNAELVVADRAAKLTHVARTGFFREIAIYVDRNSIYHPTCECADYPEPREAWVAWLFFQKPI